MPATRRRVWQPPFPRRAVCQSLEAEDGSVRSPWISPVAFPIENEVHVLHLRGKHRAFCVHGAVPPPVARVAGRLRGDCVEFRRPTPGLRASDVDLRGTYQPRGPPFCNLLISRVTREDPRRPSDCLVSVERIVASMAKPLPGSLVKSGISNIIQCHVETQQVRG